MNSSSSRQDHTVYIHFIVSTVPRVEVSWIHAVATQPYKNVQSAGEEKNSRSTGRASKWFSHLVFYFLFLRSRKYNTPAVSVRLSVLSLLVMFEQLGLTD